MVDEKTGAKARIDVWYEQRRGAFAPDMAYDGAVSYLNSRGKLGLDGVIDQILGQPATAKFLARTPPRKGGSRLALSKLAPAGQGGRPRPTKGRKSSRTRRSDWKLEGATITLA